MTHRYIIEDPNSSDLYTGTKRDSAEARNIAAQCPESFRFQISGETVSRDEFLDDCNQVEAERIARKSRTHKRIKVLCGVSGRCLNNWKEVWVRR
jgi:hypothetical protein